MTTDNTQELDEILDEFLTDIYMNNEHFAANQEALDKTKEEPMQAILDWHNKQTLELLDRLAIEVRASDYIGIAETIQSERNMLNKSNGDVR